MSRLSAFTSGLYSGEISFDFVGRRKLWYIVSTVLLLLSLTAVVVNGLKFGVEFSGGAVFSIPSEECTVEEARDAAAAEVPLGEPIVTELTGQTRQVRVQTVDLTPAETGAVSTALAEACEVPLEDVSTQVIGPSWGEQITNKALTGLAVFLVLIVFYLSITFEWRMAVGALVALFHDVFITVGIYALVGFEVTPATVIGVLTILGYSLYDTVVVFDKVKENTRGLQATSRMTYSEAANLAVNQTLVRSINTSVVGLLPVASLLFVGAYVLGAGTLKDLALALFVGIAVGTYSSICVATPVVAQLKEREPAMQALNKRVQARRAAGRESAPRGTAAADRGATVAAGEPPGPGTDGSSADGGAAPATVKSGAASTARRPTKPSGSRGPRNQPKRKSKRKR
ncbi:MAG TPA: protein translocase subunit SecF [Actinomycetes bacterium]|nr:protein translocase subunit SecF [Actinomycetes bacterium]